MKEGDVTRIKTIESINQEQIIVDRKGKFPRDLIIKDGNIEIKKYRLVKTQSDKLALNI